MLNKYLVLILVVVTLISCGETQNANAKDNASENEMRSDTKVDHVTISGSFENAKNKTIYLNEFSQRLPSDSGVVDNEGNFTFEVKVDKTNYYKLYFDQKNMIVIVLDPFVKKLELTGDARNFPNNFTMSGSKDNELMQLYFDNNRDNITESNKLMALIQAANVADKPELQAKYKAMKKSHNETLIEIAMKNPSSPAALAMISNLNPKDYMHVYDKVFGDLKSKISHTSVYSSLFKEIGNYKAKEKEKATMKDMKNGLAPEIALNNPEGETVKLSSLKGKYVLIDFWASWCGPCRRENPNVVKMYEKYKNKGFEIYGVSLDKDMGKWKAAIAKDGLTWPQVSDLAGWQSSAAAKYGVKSIPHTVLLDKKGNIIATKLRGAALEQKLAELMGS